MKIEGNPIFSFNSYTVWEITIVEIRECDNLFSSKLSSDEYAFLKSFQFGIAGWFWVRNIVDSIRHPRRYVSTCTKRLRCGPGTATADGCHTRLYVSTTADPPREGRGSAVAPLQLKMEFYPFNLKWFKPSLHLGTITEQYTWNECRTYKIYV